MGQLDIQMQKDEAEQLSHTLTKINSKWIIYLKERAKTIKLLDENIRVNLYILELDNGFLDDTQTHKQQ